jgi:hypothetical protein
LIGLNNKDEIATRVAVAYEQLSRCHSELCRSITRGDERDKLLDCFTDAIHSILNIQVELGVLKKEEEL